MTMTVHRTPRYRASDAPPSDLRGRPRPDRLLTMLGKVLERTYISYIERTEYDSTSNRHPDDPLTMALLERRVVAHDENVVELTFGLPDGGAVPSWQPGSHLDFHLPSGRRRQYSLCGDATLTDTYTVAVRRIPDGGGGSIEMHALAPGDVVTVRGPRNGFPYTGGGPALFIAGGIGITPIVAMVRAARESGIDWRLVYSGRSRDSMPFLDEIESWEQDRVCILTDDANGLPTVADLLEDAPVDGSVYCCGPTAMLAMVRAGFGETGSSALHFERFGAPPVVDGTPFQVQLVNSGVVLDVPADVSALSVIKERVPGIGYSCQQGFCGTCKVRVLAGSPDHRESRLTPTEQRDHMLICVSRADGGRLVLDV
ncbi:PDR/VanB family oxidoreductase [Antrihabitans cavernicola]|uniref:Oxidoreductase n=1 Tax=Antrihabitans cavernicola TaxID=2495913 RepID=A0A5A7SH50_9NOCA|nr:PDR/VanB family oxidoreductase [Spelaeibacter cavernicola]KAA0024954.1 oxidoreductase [Spelaeibacter cavernicola]